MAALSFTIGSLFYVVAADMYIGAEDETKANLV
jgi:hypothetical protein